MRLHRLFIYFQQPEVLMSEEDTRKIVSLMKATTPRKPAARKAPRAPNNGNVLYVTGSGNITAGGDLHLYAPQPKEPTLPPVKPGVTHITLDQRKTLKRLVDAVYETEARLKKKPKVYSAIYSALFRNAGGVKKLEQIPLSEFEAARSYLQQWLGELNSMASAPLKNADAWRNRQYSYIKVNSKAPEDAAAVAAYIKRNFQAESLTELSNDELAKTYRYAAGRKRRR